MSGESLLVPPHSAHAEASVLGGLMLDNSVWHKVHGLLAAQDFYLRRNQILFNAIGKLLSTGQPADVVTVDELIKQRGHEETVGGLGYIVTLARDTPSAANMASYAQIVRDKSTLRRLIELSCQMREMATADDANAKTALVQAEKLIFELAQRDLRGKKGFTSLKDVLKEVLDKVEINYERPKTGVLGVSSGFIDLDGYTSGFQAGDLVIVAGRPSMGKTSLGMNFAEAAAMDGKAVAVFSLEMTSVALGERILSSSSGVPFKHIRESWKIVDSDWPLLSNSIVKLNDLSMFIDDSDGLTAADIRARSMKLNMEIRDDFPEGVGMIVIDYLQRLNNDQDRSGNRNQEIEDMTRALKNLAKDLGIPVVLLSQLNRGLEGRSNKRPIMSDLRDSGGIEQDADLILFVYRDEAYNKETLDIGIAEVIIGKQRNGPLGTVRLQFDGEHVRFRSLVNGGAYADYA